MPFSNKVEVVVAMVHDVSKGLRVLMTEAAVGICEVGATSRLNGPGRHKVETCSQYEAVLWEGQICTRVCKVVGGVREACRVAATPSSSPGFGGSD